jgi:GNAT superfamily N-acetyltransferase
MSITVGFLYESPEHVPELAAWAYEQWHKRNNTNYTYVLKDYTLRGRKNSFPLTWVAYVKGRPVGMVTLKKHDLLSKRDLSPWLSALYVVPEFRKMGIGSVLIESMKSYCLSRNFKALYLFTDIVNSDRLLLYYSKFGFQFYCHGHDMFDNRVNVMKCFLSLSI